VIRAFSSVISLRTAEPSESDRLLTQDVIAGGGPDGKNELDHVNEPHNL
jgi:DNA repair protein RadC